MHRGIAIGEKIRAFSNLLEENKMKTEAENFLCDVESTAESRSGCEGGGRCVRQNWGFRGQKRFEIFILENE